MCTVHSYYLWIHLSTGSSITTCLALSVDGSLLSVAICCICRHSKGLQLPKATFSAPSLSHKIFTASMTASSMTLLGHLGYLCNHSETIHDCHSQGICCICSILKILLTRIDYLIVPDPQILHLLGFPGI